MRVWSTSFVLEENTDDPCYVDIPPRLRIFDDNVLADHVPHSTPATKPGWEDLEITISLWPLSLTHTEARWTHKPTRFDFTFPIATRVFIQV